MRKMTLKRAGILGAAVFAAVACVGAVGTAWSAVPADKAAALGTTLTKFGAEKAASADGMVPEYTGGLTSVPGFRSGDDHPVDPYASEKPLYTITAKNMDQYADHLTVGAQAFLKKFPDRYSMTVYPSHRTEWYPDWVLDNTIKNATTAKMTGEVEGDALAGAGTDGLPYPGVPFPLPQNGYEAMWNHKTSFGPALVWSKCVAYLVDPNGGVSNLSGVESRTVRAWYDTDRDISKQLFNSAFGFSAGLLDPPPSAGTVFLNYYLPNAQDGGQEVWFYSPGQRRIRKAPDFSYDTPIASYGGVLFWDEVEGFVGRMDRFNFKLVGKKEVLIPYNTFNLNSTVVAKDPRSLATKNFVNPEAMRWEMHRVWVVEAERKAGARHAYKRRQYYIDEDSWSIIEADAWDDNNNLWRVNWLLTFPSYDVGGMNNNVWYFNDMLKGNYTLLNLPSIFIRSYTSAKGVRVPLTADQVVGSQVR